MTYADIINYFRMIAYAHHDINDFRQGDDDEILNAERASIQYPCLWIETPSASPEGDSDAHEFRWNGAYTVFINSTTGNKERVDHNLEKTFIIASSILLRLKKDMRSGVFLYCTLKSSIIERIFSANNDNEQGWRVEFSILAKPPRKCLDSSQWNELYNINSHPSFSFTRTGDIISITENNPLGPNWVRSIRYTLDGTTWNLSLLPEDHVQPFYVELIFDYKGVEKVCSAFIRPSDDEGVSLPLRYNPFI